jgi:predicted NUDIX family NTP pyrophosphohydrolase
VLLAHPGGPFFVRKDAGAWSIPKGLIELDEDVRAAALREFREELGWAPAGELIPLGEARLRSGKRVLAFAVQTNERESDIVARFKPGGFAMQWPPNSGTTMQFPEVDRIAFFSLDEAAEKINSGQRVFLERLCARYP